MNGMDAALGTVIVGSSPPGRGLNADDLADMAVRKIIHIGTNVPQPLRDQALAYQATMRLVLKGYFEQAQRSAMTTAIAKLEAAGVVDAAWILRGN